MPSVFVKSKEGGRAYRLPEGRPLFIGRAKECDIVLPSPSVSRRHAVIMFKNGICGVKDLGSFNGTVVNGAVIAEPVSFQEGDVLKISSFVFTLSLREDAVAVAVQPDSPKPPKPDTRSFASGIRLPRAMSMGEDADAMMNDIPPATRRVADGPDTQVYYARKDTGKIPKQEERDDGEADADAGFDTATTTRLKIGTELIRAAAQKRPAVPEPAADAAEAAGAGEAGGTDVALTPDETEYFAEEPAEVLLRRRQLEREAAEAEALMAVDAVRPPEDEALSVRAESIIPLIEPDNAPVLTLDAQIPEGPDPTHTALEKLIEDAPVAEANGGARPGPGPGQYTSRPPETDEFSVPEGGVDEAGDRSADSGRRSTDSGGTTSRRPRSKSTAFFHTPAGVDRIPVSPALIAAVNQRLTVYSLLQDLADERKTLRMAHPNMPADLLEELDRQDRETESLPTTEEVEVNMQAARLRGSEAEGEDDGRDGLRRAVEESAFSQWLFIRDSNREALPPIYKEAYKLAADEPLARELTSAGIAHGRFLGGGIYLLALETFARSAERETRRISTRIKKLSEEGASGNTGFLRKFGKIGQMADNFRNRGEIREETAKLEEEGRVNVLRSSLAKREFAFMEKTLTREFRQLYMKVALHYLPRPERMPWPVRAFLRHGAAGFSSWWMPPKVREYVMADCRENIVAGFERGYDVLNVLYADEYLAAVAHMECPPLPDERMGPADRNSREWKTERAYRRIVNARSYNVLMKEMLAGIDGRIAAIDREAAELEARMKEVKNRPFAAGESMFDLQTGHQALVIRRANLQKYVKRIESEVVGSILDSVQDAEGRFRTGEMTMPDMRTLITREVESLFEMRLRLEGRHERFPPLVVRDHYSFRNEILNDRGTVRREFSECERLDPGLFMNTIIAAKKKANRVELRLGPVVVIIPAMGLGCMCAMGREGMEGGHLVLPTCFGRENARKRHFANLLADFRWETSRNNAGRDVMNSDTLVGAFMKIRWEWRNLPKARREKGLILNELSDQANWRRVYELYLSDAMTGCRQLLQRNPDCYAAIIGRYIDLPDGVALLRKGGDAPATGDSSFFNS